MKKRTHKLFALVLSIIIIISMLPLVTFTASAATNPYGKYQTINGVTTVRCTWYAWQQAYERTGVALPALGDGGQWYTNAKNKGLSVGTVAKANSIAVWSGDSYGHVAYVVAVSGNKMTVNEGGQFVGNTIYGNEGVVNGAVWSNVIGSVKTSGSNKKLVGFIYLTSEQTNIDDYYKLTAPDGYQSLRSSASTSSSELARIPAGTIVNVTQYNSDKSWGYLTYDGKSGWIRLYYVEKTEKPHIHSYGQNYEDDHPHRVYKKCSCGDYYYTGETKFVSTCEKCLDTVRPAKSILNVKKDIYTKEDTITFSWEENNTNLTHYCLYFDVYDESKKEYVNYDYTNTYVKPDVKKSFPVGKYKARLLSYNSNYWEANNSDWLHVSAEPFYFTVKEYQEYTVSYNLGGGKNDSVNPKTYKSTSGDITLKNPTKKGYKFVGWYNGSRKVTKIAEGTNKNITLTANWSKNTYKITYKLNGGKNNAKNPKTYTVTTSAIIFKNPTRKGYTFKGWYSDSKLKTKVTKIAKGSTGNKKLYAKWAKTYTITYKLNGGKNNKDNPKTYTKIDSTIVLKAPTRKGYVFKGWYKDAKFKTKVSKIKKDSWGKKTFYAKWQKMKK